MKKSSAVFMKFRSRIRQALFLSMAFFCACTARMEVDMEEYGHFRYAHMLSSISGSNLRHIIYLQGYKPGIDDEELQLLALDYIKNFDTFERVPQGLIFVSKKVFSADQPYHDYRLATITFECFNNKVYISNATGFKGGIHGLQKVKQKIEFQCLDW